MEERKLFSSVTGLNTKIDPVRLRYDQETGVTDLSQTQDIVIDDTGRPNMRKGSNLITEGELHSGFCAGREAVCVEEGESSATLNLVNSDLSLTALRTGLTQDKRCGYVQVNDMLLYANTVQNGYIKSESSYAWPTDTFKGPQSTNRKYSTTPVGEHLGFHAGRVIVTVENAAYFTEPFKFGLCDLKRMMVQLESDLTMVAPVRGGVFISDSNKTVFFRGSDPLRFEEEIIVVDAPAHKHSLVQQRVTMKQCGYDGFGFVQIWTSPVGVCVGLPTGEVDIITEDKIEYPDVKEYGSTLFWDGPYGRQILSNTF